MSFERTFPPDAALSTKDLGQPVTVTISCAGKSEIYTDLRLGLVGMASSDEENSVTAIVFGSAPDKQTASLCECLITMIAIRGLLEEALYLAVEAEDGEELQPVRSSLATLMTALKKIQNPNTPEGG